VALAVGRPAIHPGESLYLRLTVTNPTDGPLALAFPTSASADFRVESVDGAVVWSLSEERAALLVPNEIALAPGESRSFEEVWLGRTNEGDAAAPGSYFAVGSVPSAQGGETPPVAFQIR
jgi:intracellular proteinase inhibitor BsuPI